MIDIITQGKLPEVNVEPVQVFVHFMHNVLYYHPNQIDLLLRPCGQQRAC